jgi:hypothetical protein
VKQILILTATWLSALALPGWADTNGPAEAGTPIQHPARLPKAPTGSYHSWQHPEWPPLPGPVASNLPTYRLHQTNLPGTNNFLMDDRGHEYPLHLPAWDPELQYVKHPETLPYLRGEVHGAELEASRTLKPEDMERASRYRSRLERVLAKQKTINPAPFSEVEESEMRSLILIAECCRTNTNLGPTNRILRVSSDREFISFWANDASCRRARNIAPLALRALQTQSLADFQAYLTLSTNYDALIPK